MKISVITPSYQRPKDLYRCCQYVWQQDFPANEFEHIVVLDGEEAGESKQVCNHFPCRVIYPKKKMIGFGNEARDLGIAVARGEYVVFWDDDNYYCGGALAELYEASVGFDVGIVQILHRNIGWQILPKERFTVPIRCQIDSMNFCVRTEVARKFCWKDGDAYQGDFEWIDKVFKSGATSNFRQSIVGVHL